MRRLLFIGVVLIASSLFAATGFKDIPKEHWAKQSVDRIVDMGIATGYQDGTFRGRKSVTRYELALYLSNFEHVIAKRYKLPPVSKEQPKSVAQLDEEIQALRKEVRRLRKELAAVQAH